MNFIRLLRRFEGVVPAYRFFPASDSINYDDVDEVVVDQNTVLETYSSGTSNLVFCGIVNPIEEDWISQVQELEVLLNYALAVDEVL